MSSDEGFQRVEKAYRVLDEPSLTVKPDGSSYINKSATLQWFEDVESVGILVDQATMGVAFDRNCDDEDAYSVIENKGNPGMSILLSGALNALGVDREGFETEKVSLEEREDGLIVADLSSLPQLERRDNGADIDG